MKQFSVAVVLFIGLRSNDYQLRVGDDGNALEIKFAWPVEILSPHILQKA